MRESSLPSRTQHALWRLFTLAQEACDLTAPNPAQPVAPTPAWSPAGCRSPHRLAHMQALLDVPHPRRGRLHHRNAKVLFQRSDDAERVEAQPQDGDRVRAFACEKCLLDQPAEHFRRKVGNPGEGHVDGRVAATGLFPTVANTVVPAARRQIRRVAVVNPAQYPVAISRTVPVASPAPCQAPVTERR